MAKNKRKAAKKSKRTLTNVVSVKSHKRGRVKVKSHARRIKKPKAVSDKINSYVA